MKKRIPWFAVTMFLVFLAACSSSGDDPPPPPQGTDLVWDEGNWDEDDWQ